MKSRYRSRNSAMTAAASVCSQLDSLRAAILLLMALSCGPNVDQTVCREAEVRRQPTKEDEFLGLTSGQHAAVLDIVGTVDGIEAHCSGVLVSSDRLLTASHCLPLLESEDALVSSSDRRATIERSIVHPAEDAALLELRWLDDRGSGGTPLSLFSADLNNQWVGRRALVGGFGRTERLVVGSLHFSVQEIVAVDTGRIEVAGLDTFGVCSGDSGGPLLARDETGAVRILGILNSTSSNCRKSGFYTRSDVLVDWLDSIGIEPAPADAHCGALPASGRCNSDQALWCGSDAQVRIETCEDACGWSDREQGFRCVKSDNPCLAIGAATATGPSLFRTTVAPSVASIARHAARPAPSTS